MGLKFGQGPKKKTSVIAVNNPSPPVSQQIGTFVSSPGLAPKAKLSEPKEEKKGKYLSFTIHLKRDLRKRRRVLNSEQRWLE